MSAAVLAAVVMIIQASTARLEKSYVERTWDLFASCWFGGVNKIFKTSLKEITEKYQALFPGKGAGGVKS